MPLEISKGGLTRIANFANGELNMGENKDKPRQTIFRKLAMKRSQETDKEKPEPELVPAMPELGTAPCPVCGHRVAVFVTRTKRPFVNCGFCSARIFYNGSRSQRILQKQIEPPEEPDRKGGSPVLNGLQSLVRGKP